MACSEIFALSESIGGSPCAYIWWKFAENAYAGIREVQRAARNAARPRFGESQGIVIGGRIEISPFNAFCESSHSIAALTGQ
jgi:hypothetical protein